MNPCVSTPLVLSFLALLAYSAVRAAQPPQTSQADIIKQSAPTEWRRLDPENTLVMQINDQQVILELAPRFAPQHAANPAKNQAWLAHCYGMVGAARSTKPDSSNGTSLYAINGQAPRALDLNITVVGRVVKGMEVLSSLPRGSGAMGFYDKPERYVPITQARLLADIPMAEQPAIEIMRTDNATWRSLVEASRHAIGGWAVRSALHSNICNRTVPTRAIAASQ